jgi:hypothetical protein
VIGATAGRVWPGVPRAFIPANRAVAASLLIGPRRSAVRLRARRPDANAGDGDISMVPWLVLRWESLDALGVLQEARLASESASEKPGWLASRPLRTIRRSSCTQFTFANFPVPHWNKIREPIRNPYTVTYRVGDRANLMNALPVLLPYMYAAEPCAPSPRSRRTRRGRPEGET